jgi:hypothetical protein
LDWTPERAVQAKIWDFQKKRKKIMQKWLLKHTSGRALCAGLQMATASKLLINNGLYPQGHQLLPCVGLHPINGSFLFTIISFSMNFAECLYCDVSPFPILPILSHFIKSPVIYSLYSHVSCTITYSHIHTFIYSYIYTFIHSYLNTFTYSYTTYA